MGYLNDLLTEIRLIRISLQYIAKLSSPASEKERKDAGKGFEFATKDITEEMKVNRERVVEIERELSKGKIGIDDYNIEEFNRFKEGNNYLWEEDAVEEFLRQKEIGGGSGEGSGEITDEEIVERLQDLL